ncbi:FAD dependent oxidoreductase [Naematelia encephala]|uniref:FAD dependent oxidoreductase n=1 Tax=Naematelia encephala TaxID=71784 RepID=A0A1Y2B2A3_9TREE|nr:FAD dependent oxidoreductase [Naematelia encephala]
MTTNAESPWGPSVLPNKWQRSYWQRSVGDESLLHHGREDSLPDSADVVIIGSGLSGATTAYHLLSAEARPRTVVCLEARELCSGASGRNAGHCRPDAFRGFADYAKIHGEVEARKIIASERITLDKVVQYVNEHEIECELTLRPTVDLILSKEFERYVDTSFQLAKNAGVDVQMVKRLGQDETRDYTGSPIALGSYVWPAASIHPLKLCLGVHRKNMALGGYSLYTHCPVVSVAKDCDSWLVSTVRGQIKAGKVVFATNAYTSLLLPELAKMIEPCSIHASKVAQAPSEGAPLEPTMSLRFSLDRFYSYAPQPDRSAVLGIAAQLFPNKSMDDSAPSAEVEEAIFGSILQVLPDHGYTTNAGIPVQGHGGYEYSWLGVVGMTPDRVPLVGQLPGKDGLFIIAGMGGHGMARIFHCAPTLAEVMLGGQWDPTLPAVYQPSPDRLQREFETASD